MLNYDSLIGLSKEDAINRLKNFKAPYRIRSEDGNVFVLTRDFKPDRVNLVIAGGKVLAYNKG